MIAFYIKNPLSGHYYRAAIHNNAQWTRSLDEAYGFHTHAIAVSTARAIQKEIGITPQILKIEVIDWE